ncbi:hypothetical protein [Naasia aerilata]|uniref:Uncharacterized protein n=1 Tax=Naasia aerilata TaxID=1162966 RepID=A0ABM8GFP2_9MICO|nr:hypothetical protein [Naasia aerilata]BDZ47163.1 hypothetical protein GCM10025866_30720 [Naasia aerilata]
MQASAPAIPRATSRFGGHALDAVLFAVAAILLLADLTMATASRAWTETPAYAFTYYPGLIALVLAAGISLRIPGQLVNGRLMLGIVAVAAVVDQLAFAPDVGPAFFLQGILYNFVPALFAHLLLRWPEDRLQTRPQRWILWVFYLVLPLLTFGWQVTWKLEWFGGGTDGWWWLTLAPDEALSTGIYVAWEIVTLLAVATALVLIALRIAAAPRERRRLLVPVAIAAALLGITVLVSGLQAVFGFFWFDTEILQNLAILAVGGAVLVEDWLTSRSGPRSGALRPRPATDRPTEAIAEVRDSSPSSALPVVGPRALWLAIGAVLVAAAVLLGALRLATASDDSVPHPEPQPAPQLPEDMGPAPGI